MYPFVHIFFTTNNLLRDLQGQFWLNLYAFILWPNQRSHSWNADCTLYLFDITHIDRLFMRFTDVGQQGRVRPSLTNEVEADKLFPVSEVFRFDSQVGFL